MGRLRTLWQSITTILCMALLASAAMLAENRQVGRTCQAVDIVVKQVPQSSFLQVNDIEKQLVQQGLYPLIGLTLGQLDLRALNSCLQSHLLVHQAMAYKLWRGGVKLVVWPKLPIARIARKDGLDQYVDHVGDLLPLVDHCSVRVLPLSGAYFSPHRLQLAAYPGGAQLLALLLHIYQDDFLRAQIAHMQIDHRGNVTLYTQVGNQKICFGKAHGFEQKFDKLRLFYEQLIPYKGWGRYRTIRLEFDHQIVCE